MELIAHRGMPRKARENTLAGFALAIAAGADGIELDVHATRDGAIVVHHDPALPLPAGSTPGLGPRAIASLTLAQLRDATTGGTDIPTLGETLALVGDRVTLYVEIKAAGIEPAVVASLARHEGRSAVHSFDHRVSLRVRELAPRLPTGILSASYLIEPGHTLQGAGARDYWQWWEMIDAPLVRQVHDAGGRVVAWTVNSAEAVDRLAALGVDAICTDVSDDLAALVRKSPQR